MTRLLFFLYGVVCYAATVASLVYAAGFIANIGVPKSIDTAPTADTLRAILTNVALLGVFAVQHSVMARQGFKRIWTRIVPTTIERSTYCLFSAAALGLLMWKWQPLGGMIYHVDVPALRYVLWGLNVLGWVLVYYSSFLINHFDLFGLRQVWLNLRGKPYTPLAFKAPALYRWVRHPLYVGLLLAVWATPTMTVTHLLFAVGVLGYILVGIQFEERDLIANLGTRYAAYRRRVPMLWPALRPRNLAKAGVAFFAIKGMLWLIVPLAIAQLGF
jgi:protein-S-isoprenylcysteine O-methyltransferase Ste14